MYCEAFGVTATAVVVTNNIFIDWITSAILKKVETLDNPNFAIQYVPWIMQYVCNVLGCVLINYCSILLISFGLLHFVLWQFCELPSVGLKNV